MKVLVRRASYEYRDLKEVVYAQISTLLTCNISGKRVLIKPNLLLPATPAQAICTHPALVRAVVEYVLEQGGLPFVADSPAIGSFGKILQVTGLKESLSGLPVKVQPFLESTKVEVGPPFGTVELAREALESEVVINLPKFKTHSQMLLTLGVKNLFGCCVGYRKVEWHLRAGVDRAYFASLLLSIAQKISPHVTILDGILALEGEGPGKRGTPRQVGILVASDDPLGVDVAVCRMLGLRTRDVPVLQAAEQRGLSLTFEGEEGVEEGVIKDFQLPPLEPLIGTAGPFEGVIRRHFLARPAVERRLCRMCGECRKICPVQAIGEREKRLIISYDRCIRCYCCLEICPYGAMRKEEEFPARALKFILEKVL